MSASQTVSGRSAAKFRPSRFGATGWSCRLSVVRGTRRRRAAGRQAASAHEPRHPPAADPDAILAQLGVDAGAAVGPPARLEDRGDPPGEAGILARAAAGAPAQPGVEAARRD